MQIRTIAIVAAVAAAGLAAVLALRTGPEPGQAPAPTPPAVATAPGKGSWMDPRMLATRASLPAEDFVAAPATVFYGRNGRPVDFGGKDAAAYIAERAARARTGDQKAAYEAYQAASGCAAAQDPLPEFFSETERQAAERERERMRFLGQLADAGNRGAQVDFYMEGPGGKPVDLQARADDPEVQQWKQQAIAYLQQAGAGCDQFALGLLSNAYDAGQLVAHDPGKAMAYAIASNAARRHPLTEQQLRGRFGEELAPADFNAAMQAGTQLATSSCPRS
jgi:hypothetical protein